LARVEPLARKNDAKQKTSAYTISAALICVCLVICCHGVVSFCQIDTAAIVGRSVRFGSLADICSAKGHVRFNSESGHVRCNYRCRLWANSGLMQRSNSHTYSITSTAVASNVAGTSRPSALAVVTLMTRSNLVGCSTGISPGFAPRRILSTYSAARRYWLGRFDP